MRLRVVCVLMLSAVAGSTLGSALRAQGAGDTRAAGGGGIVTGRVTDGRTKGPIPSVTVAVEGTEETAVTGADGRYRLSRVPAGVRAITARGIGFSSERLQVTVTTANPTVADFVLHFSEVNLQQIVVTGTAGDQTRAANGAVVASIDASQIVAEAPVSSVTEVLQSRVPSVNVADGSGTTGTAPKITIRGPASISLSDAPIVFIDGVRVDATQRNVVGNYHNLEQLGGQSVTALNDLNPDDIESIEIVKGPAASTLYGADASAGVINIITKKGKLSARGFRQTATAEYDAIEPNFTPYAVYGTCGAADTVTGGPALCQGQAPGTVISDNPLVRDHVFSTGFMGLLNYSGQGGTDNFGYFVSGSASNSQGITQNNSYQRRTGRANIHWLVLPQLAVDATMALSRNDYHIPQGDDSQYSYLIDGGLESSPFSVTLGPNGEREGGPAFAIAGLNNIQDEIITTRVTPTVQVQYTPLPWFSHRIILGADLASTEGITYFPVNDQGWYNGDQANGYLENTQNPVNTYTVDYLGNIKAKFGHNDWITSNLSFGSQYIDIVNNNVTGVGLGFLDNQSNLLSSAASSESHQVFTESKSLGLYGQEELGFSDVLFVQGGLRIDQNSAFGKDYGAFYLPKVAGSYVISQEPFWKPVLPAVSTMRLRAAWGTTGRSPTPGASLATYTPTSYVTPTGGVGPGVVPFSPGNADLKPERGTEFEGGVDAGFLHDRIGLELTYFDKRTTNLLLLAPIAPSLGYTGEPYENAGTVDNSGLEFTIRAEPIRQRDVDWNVEVNGNTLRNNLVSLGGLTISPVSLLFPDLTVQYVNGKPLSSFYSSKIIGVNTTAGYATVTNTPVYDGPQFPTFQANFNTSITLFHVLKLYALVNMQRGGKILNLGQLIQDLYGLSAQTNLPQSEGGYSKEQFLRRFGPFQTANGTPVSGVLDAYVQRTDFTRLSELSATLSLPEQWTHALYGTSASLTVGGRNLALWKASDYQGWDPEINSNTTNTGTNQFLNSEEYTVPLPRLWFVRLNLSF
jgi:TonB-dependent starch-binding outer membrane protein SusC